MSKSSYLKHDIGASNDLAMIKMGIAYVNKKAVPGPFKY